MPVARSHNPAVASFIITLFLFSSPAIVDFEPPVHCAQRVRHGESVRGSGDDRGNFLSFEIFDSGMFLGRKTSPAFCWV